MLYLIYPLCGLEQTYNSTDGFTNFSNFSEPDKDTLDKDVKNFVADEYNTHDPIPSHWLCKATPNTVKYFREHNYTFILITPHVSMYEEWKCRAKKINEETYQHIVDFFARDIYEITYEARPMETIYIYDKNTKVEALLQK